MKTKPEIHIPDDEEDALLTAAATTDEDNPPLTEKELTFVAQRARGRPALVPELKKVPISIRVEPDVLEAFKATGAGWQNKMNQALREWADAHDMLAADERKRSNSDSSGR